MSRMLDALQKPPRTVSRETARDGSGRTIRVASTACGHRWAADEHDSPWEREAPTTAFGRLLAEACRTMVGPMIERTGRTFMNGGCAMLADALVTWSEGRLHTVAVLYHGRLDHVVASDGRSFLDSDGRFDRKGFGRKSLILDDDHLPFVERSPWIDDGNGIARDEQVSAWLTLMASPLLPDPATEPWRRRR